MQIRHVQKVYIYVKLMHDVLQQCVCTTWNQDIFNMDMLPLSKTEYYVKVVTNRQNREALSQYRCGVLPLKVETGIFQDIPVEYSLCTMCEENVIETKSHILLYCTKYNQLRYQFFY